MDTAVDPRNELAGRARELRNLLSEFELRLAELGPAAEAVLPRSPGEFAEVRRSLEAAELDRLELAQRLVSTERQASRLMSLYVVTYQLHSTLDPEEVKAAIAEITLDLLGAERFVLVLREETDGRAAIALSRGLEDGGSELFRGDSYPGGDAAVDAALIDGQVRLDPPNSEAIGIVPLKIRDSVVGALVVLKLFGHRTKPLSEDRELLDLLAAHAASALLAARAYSTMVRRVRTLEGLLTLLKG
jgi:GAF domain